MKCKECKYYFNGTCSTGVFRDLDDDTVIKIELGCKYSSLNKQLKKENGAETSKKKALNLDVVIKSVCSHPIEYQHKEVDGYEMCKLCGERI